MITSSKKAEITDISAAQYYDDGSGVRMKLDYDNLEQSYTLELPGGATYTELTDEDLGVLIDLIHVVRSARSAGRRASDEGS